MPDEQAGLHHPDHAGQRLLQRGRIGDRPEPAIEDEVAAIGDETADGRCPRAQHRIAPQRGKPSGRGLPAEATTSTGTGTVAPSRSTSFGASATITSRSLAAATIFSRSNAPPRPLIRFSEPRAISSAPSIVSAIRRCSAKVVSVMPPSRACFALRSEVGMPRIFSPWRTRSASASMAKAAVEPVPRPDHHAVLHQCHRCLRRGALLVVAAGGPPGPAAAHRARTARNTRSQLPAQIFATSSSVNPCCRNAAAISWWREKSGNAAAAAPAGRSVPMPA